MMYQALSLFLLAVAAPAVRSAPVESYDYIVVGSGPGGGPLACNLARAGYSTLLIEAGTDQGDNPNSAQLLNFNLATNDPLTRWDFFTRHSDDDARERKFSHYVYRNPDNSFYSGLDPPKDATPLGIWYPRAGTLGGCAMHNAGVSNLPQDSDWQHIVNLTGDTSWEASQMREYFVRLESNSFLPKGTEGHGFNGWLSTISGDNSWVNGSTDGKEIIVSLAKVTDQDVSKLSELVIRDANAPDPNRDQMTGFVDMVQHGYPNFTRSSPNNYIRATLRDPAKYPLTVQLNTLVTKILFDANATSPTAVGVEVLQGSSLYRADPKYTVGSKGTVAQYRANKEVIISGGTFNTPQILKLSGIGPAHELQHFNIPVVVDLPGVGENLADNYEAGMPALFSKNITSYPGQVAIMLRTPTAPTSERNFMAWCGVFSFEGYWPGYPFDYGPTEFECAGVQMSPKSQAGYVHLASADPQDTPDINFRFYQNNADADLTELLDMIKVFRAAFNGTVAPLWPFNETHPCPGIGNTCTDTAQKEWLMANTYSHHATSSCAIGADDDPMAVLDSRFRVRGVKNLRVVDASVYPKVPGAFPVLPTYMLSEKATDVIIADAKAAAA